MAAIEKGVAEAESGGLTEERSEAVAGEAHKLVGSLGTFGLRMGSDIARQLERLFAAGMPVDSVDEATSLTETLRDIVETGPSA